MEEQAFPAESFNEKTKTFDYQKGLTKREYASIEALKGILANHLTIETEGNTSRIAIAQADSLLKMLKEGV